MDSPGSCYRHGYGSSKPPPTEPVRKNRAPDFTGQCCNQANARGTKPGIIQVQWIHPSCWQHVWVKQTTSCCILESAIRAQRFAMTTCNQGMLGDENLGLFPKNI
ncbi:hypothetical protein AVEN_225579-1 [Araneus ventricosus]|uniref:Uncharacterized protein n=1 Tax=Araneus ventricosus TaxID=182803 RepID=A0A4Y2MQR1_ARAVE|nr:hypothetical protein AVEN_225579-1 [Araneus ventricosus]